MAMKLRISFDLKKIVSSLCTSWPQYYVPLSPAFHSCVPLLKADEAHLF